MFVRLYVLVSPADLARLGFTCVCDFAFAFAFACVFVFVLRTYLLVCVGARGGGGVRGGVRGGGNREEGKLTGVKEEKKLYTRVTSRVCFFFVFVLALVCIRLRRRICHPTNRTVRTSAT